MNRLCWRIVLLATLGLGVSGQASAQGGFMDWITKLSGPELYVRSVEIGYCRKPETLKSPWLSCQKGWRWQAALGHSVWVGNEPMGRNGDIDLLLPQISAQYLFPIGESNWTQIPQVGLDVFHFYGDGFEDFDRWVPVLSYSLRLSLGGILDGWRVDFGGRVRYFDDDVVAEDFFRAPRFDVNESEWNGGLFIAFGIH